MSLRVNSLCYECHLKRSLARARKLGDEDTATAFARDLMEIFLREPVQWGSPWLNVPTMQLLDRYYHLGEDPYREEKRASNAFFLARMEEIQQRIHASPDPLYSALQFAILGNYIDFAALQDQVDMAYLSTLLDKAKDMVLDGPTYDRLKQDLAKAETLLYLTDNAGEIGFDRLCAETMQAVYPHLKITFCVRGGYAMNDATREDAAAVGVSFPVIDSGAAIPATIISKLGPQAKAAMESADVIFAKGMANVESLLGEGYPVYYAFLVKCPRFEEYFGKEKMTPMLYFEEEK